MEYTEYAKSVIRDSLADILTSGTLEYRSAGGDCLACFELTGFSDGSLADCPKVTEACAEGVVDSIVAITRSGEVVLTGSKEDANINNPSLVQGQEVKLFGFSVG